MPAYARSKLFVLKTIAVFAYVTCLLQWCLVIFPFVASLVESGAFEVFTPQQSQPSEVVTTGVATLPSWVVMPLVAIIAVAVIVATVVSLFRTPREIGKTAQKVTHTAAQRVVPVVTHHKKIPKKKQLALTARIIFDLKLLLLGLPLILIFFVPMDQIGVPRELLVVMMAVLAGWALFLFCLQVVLARAFRIPLKELW